MTNRAEGGEWVTPSDSAPDLRRAGAGRSSPGYGTGGAAPRYRDGRSRPGTGRSTRPAQAALAFVAYMSTYSWPESRMTSAMTESVTARRT